MEILQNIDASSNTDLHKLVKRIKESIKDMKEEFQKLLSNKCDSDTPTVTDSTPSTTITTTTTTSESSILSIATLKNVQKMIKDFFEKYSDIQESTKSKLTKVDELIEDIIKTGSIQIIEGKSQRALSGR